VVAHQTIHQLSHLHAIIDTNRRVIPTVELPLAVSSAGQSGVIMRGARDRNRGGDGDVEAPIEPKRIMPAAVAF
jgi:hypothetical protein